MRTGVLTPAVKKVREIERERERVTELRDKDGARSQEILIICEQVLNFLTTVGLHTKAHVCYARHERVLKYRVLVRAVRPETPEMWVGVRRKGGGG